MGDSSKVRIRRVAGVEPIMGFSYIPFRTPEMEAMPHSQSAAHFHPDPEQDVFEVSADIATAAVQTGGFEVDPSSRVKLIGGRAVEESVGESDGAKDSDETSQEGGE